MAFSASRLAQSLAAQDPGWRAARHCIAYSGGLDSTVLLHAFAALARESGTPLRALHVDHGLQPQSREWAKGCADACARLGIDCAVLRLAMDPARGESLEAAARAARYGALRAAILDGERLHAAHQADDQFETVLMQLLRGAGLPGLAAMPPRAPFGPGWLLRPLLGFTRAELAAWAQEAGLVWREDPMNADLRFERAWLRARVLPALRERWPAAATTSARSARHAAEASRLLDEVARDDAAGLLDDGRLSVAGLAALSPERQSNVLRWWLKSEGLRAPPAARIACGLADLLRARDDGAPRLAWEDGEIRRYRGRLYALAARPASAPAVAGACTDSRWELGAGLGSFRLVEGTGAGLCARRAARATLRFRAGGESLKPHPGRPRKRLKDLCQEAGIVPWMRDRLPLVYVGEELAAVGDLWIDAGFAAGKGSPALMPVWDGRPRLF
jgi:tRNA(Ile)-lysidine synthase